MPCYVPGMGCIPAAYAIVIFHSYNIHIIFTIWLHFLMLVVGGGVVVVVVVKRIYFDLLSTHSVWIGFISPRLFAQFVQWIYCDYARLNTDQHFLICIKQKPKKRRKKVQIDTAHTSAVALQTKAIT